VPAELPALSADRERVHQVLFNLVDNAVRFTPDGGSVTISARRRNGSVEVAVADTGAGIAPEHLPRLFERFYRADAARTRGEGGTGIGLAIARSVVEAHGGRISAESEPGRGSVFTFDLPSADGGTG
jgi:signal transduction histidine kinase